MSDQFPPDMLDEMLRGQLDQQIGLLETDIDDARMTERLARLDDSALSTDPTKDAEYRRLVHEGKKAVSLTDSGKWLLCYLAVELVTRFNEDTLGEWAAEIGIGASTARHYRRIGIFYNFAEREAFMKTCEQNLDGECDLYFSHFGDAIVLPTPALAYEWLRIVAAGHWSVDFARSELQKWMQLRGYEKRKPGKQPAKRAANVVCEKVGVYGPTFTQKNHVWTVTFKLSEDEDMVKALIDKLINQKQPMYLALTKTTA